MRYMPNFLKRVLNEFKKFEYKVTNDYGDPSTTMNEEVVRSKGEKKIADFLYKNGIEYRYEKPIKGALRELEKEDPYIHYHISEGKYGDKEKFELRKEPIPDFYLPKYDIYIEYWGSVGKKDYNMRMREKKEYYEKNEIQIINLYLGNLTNIGPAFIKEFKKATGHKFPQYLKYFKY